MSKPNWFVQTEDGVLHGYFTREVLLCDLWLRRGENVRILELEQGMLTRYRPVTAEQVRAEAVQSCG